jgi:ABC-type glycerol-3-phosphate transport system substrate-binding protein
MKHRITQLGVILSALMMVIGLVPTMAQDTVTLSIAVPEFLLDGFPEEALAGFEAQHNIKVHIKASTQSLSFVPSIDVDSYFDDMEGYASEADILMVSSASQINTEVTRAGILLDLSPLILSDPTFNTDDFYFPVWQSFQWDGGIWGVPMVADVIGIAYQPDIFDQNNMPYPDSWFSPADVDIALRELVTYDDEGNVQTPSFLDISNSLDMMLYAMSGGQRVVDDLQFPSAPDYSNPAYEELIQLWADLLADDIVAASGSGFQYLQDAPVLLIPSIFASASGFGVDNFSVTTLPGGYIGLSTTGLAVSSGTQYPQEAYEFVKYVSQDPQLSNAFLGVVPARRSLLGADEGEEGAIASLFNPSEEIMALVNQHIDSAIAPPDLRYGSYLSLAIDKVINDGIDPATALQETEQEVLERLRASDERGEDMSIVVATPPPDVVFSEGEIALEFGVSAFTTNLSNQETWDATIADFISFNPDVANINVTGATFFSGNSLSDLSEQYDCFYNTGNIVQSGDISRLLNISPLIASDATIDPSDFIGGSLNQMTRENQIYGLPVEIQPQSMTYDTDLINQGGAFPPYSGWTVADFENILRTLKIDPEDPAPFSPKDFGGGAYLMNLIAAYGGVPIDYRTQPITLDFTSPATVEAIRQVLDLAKDGYLDYEELADFNRGGIFAGQGDPVALYTQVINSFTLDLDLPGDDDEEGDNVNNPQIPVPFPIGTQFSAVNYDIGGLYVSSQTDFADACYRFISFASTNPTLLTAMPARRSVLAGPDMTTLQSPETIQLYNDIAFKMDSPNTVTIPVGFDSGIESTGDQLLILWLIQAFDRYVLEDADLETELETAQLFSDNYRGCAAEIPPYDPAIDQVFGYVGKFFDCAIQVDPAMGDILPNLGG